MADAPKRAVSFTLNLQADSRKEVVAALEQIQFLIMSEQMTRGVSGGYGSGYTYEYEERDGPTHDEYAAQLEAYLEAERARVTP